jgi:hypothetical protein
MQRMPGASGTRRLTDGDVIRSIWPYIYLLIRSY